VQWSDIPFRPSRQSLRQFAGLWVLCFGGLAAWYGLQQGNPTAGWVLGAVAAAVGLGGALRPPLLRPLYVGWLVLVFPVGWLVAQLTLIGLFFGVFTPVGLYFRLSGRDALARRLEPGRETYWVPRAAPPDVRGYLRRF
jgi:hypothetical protein